jgi:hypothetical protein
LEVHREDRKAAQLYNQDIQVEAGLKFFEDNTPLVIKSRGDFTDDSGYHEYQRAGVQQMGVQLLQTHGSARREVEAAGSSKAQRTHAVNLATLQGSYLAASTDPNERACHVDCETIVSKGPCKQKNKVVGGAPLPADFHTKKRSWAVWYGNPFNVFAANDDDPDGDSDTGHAALMNVDGTEDLVDPEYSVNPLTAEQLAAWKAAYLCEKPSFTETVGKSDVPRCSWFGCESKAARDAGGVCFDAGHAFKSLFKLDFEARAGVGFSQNLLLAALTGRKCSHDFHDPRNQAIVCAGLFGAINELAGNGGWAKLLKR